MRSPNPRRTDLGGVSETEHRELVLQLRKLTPEQRLEMVFEMTRAERVRQRKLGLPLNPDPS